MSVSYLNSLVQQNVVNGFSFIGVYDSCLQYAQIQVIINTTTINNDYNIIIEYSNDQTVILYTENVNYCDIINNILYFTPKAKFSKVSLTANSNLDDLSINTMFKVSNVFISTVVSSISNDVLVHGDVNVIDSIPLQVKGIEPQFRFHATPATNIAAVYTDGAPGVNVNGGWLYVNNGASSGLNKINWYVYANSADQASTAKKVSSIVSMYAVIYQKPLTVAPEDSKNPFIAFYTLPEAANNTSWYKNRYNFSAYTDQSSVVGLKLLYIGVDNPLIHPEITTRIQLLFDAINSTNTLAGGATEDLWLGTIGSSSNIPAGQYNFVFSEYGIDFTEEARLPTILPIIDDKVQVSLATNAATETTLASIKAKTDNIPLLGQQLAELCTPVVLTALQITALTQSTTTVDPYLQISKSLVSGSSPVYISGENPAVVKDTIEDLWGSSVASWIPPTIATTVNIVSNSIADTASGTGARAISISGLDGSYNQVSEVLTLNGTTNVATTLSYRIIHKMVVIYAGSGNTAAGTISSVWTGGGTPVGPNIVLGQNSSQSCIYQVPVGYSLYITNYKIGSHDGGKASGFLMAKPLNGVYNCIEICPTNVYLCAVIREFQPPMKILQYTTIKFQTTVNTVLMQSFGSIDGILVLN